MANRCGEERHCEQGAFLSHTGELRKDLLMFTRPQLGKRCILFPLAATLVVFALGSGRAVGQFDITEIVDATGDGAVQPGFGVLTVPQGGLRQRE